MTQYSNLPVPRDPFESYAASDPGLQFGNLIKHNGKTGGWTIGKANEPVDLGAHYVAIYEAALVGFTKWVGGRPDHKLVALSSGPDLRALRETLGDLDQSHWARNTRGEPQDPWKNSVVMPFVDPETIDDCFTFSTSNVGGVRAAKQLFRACAAERRKSPEKTRGRYVVIALGETSYDAGQNGRIFNPTFQVLDDWAPAGPINEMLRLVGVVPPVEYDQPSLASPVNTETIHEIVEPEPPATKPTMRDRMAPLDEDDSEPDVRVRGRRFRND